MKTHPLATGIFVFTALLLFSIVLFLVGDRHKAFAHHDSYYTEFKNVNGIQQGSKVRVSGFDAGEVTQIEIPQQPSAPFRIKLKVDDKLRSLIRSDSFVSVESDGLVGDKFLMIHQGTGQSSELASGATLPGKEPIEISAVLGKMTGLMDQANNTIGDLQGKLDGTLDAVHTAVNHADGMVANANGMVSDARYGKGTVGMLLNDPKTAGHIRDAVSNTQQATANLNQVSSQAKQLMTDIQNRNLPQKADDTLTNARNASQQLSQTTEQVNNTLTEALGPDRSGEDAGANLRETLSNVNLATANMSEDTEALKHEFFFRGFFKKRGYYSLHDLTPDQYRANRYFDDPHAERDWLSSEAFTRDQTGKDTLSEVGRMQVDHIIGAHKSSADDQPIVIEGYSNQSSGSEEMIESRAHTQSVARYIEKRYHLSAKNVGLMPLNANPPASTGKTTWDGACLVFPPKPGDAKTK